MLCVYMLRVVIYIYIYIYIYMEHKLYLKEPAREDRRALLFTIWRLSKE